MQTPPDDLSEEDIYAALAASWVSAPPPCAISRSVSAVTTGWPPMRPGGTAERGRIARGAGSWENLEFFLRPAERWPYLCPPK
jgi:hypothetical protein